MALKISEATEPAILYLHILRRALVKSLKLSYQNAEYYSLSPENRLGSSATAQKGLLVSGLLVARTKLMFSSPPRAVLAISYCCLGIPSPLFTLM